MNQNFMNIRYFLWIALFPVFSVWAQPTDNPIATFNLAGPYAGEGYPAWTDEIRWNNVVNMGTFTNGANDFEKFENARDQLYGLGGGVLYYPAGSYDFKDHPTGPTGRGLMLKKGVVIRGQAPATNQWAVKSRTDISDDSGLSSLETIFNFPTWDKKTNPVNELTVVAGNGIVPRTWNHIGIMPVAPQTVKDVNQIGICWVKIRFATVYFGGDMPWGATWGTAGAWQSSAAKTTNAYGENWSSRVPDGTHPFDPFTGAAPNLPYIKGAQKRLVFGCRFENAVATDDIWKKGNYSTTTTDSLNYGYFGSRFIPRVAVDGDHIYLANNIIAKPTESFYYNMKHHVMIPENAGCHGGCTPTQQIRTLLFDYARSIGFDVNKSLYSQRSNRCILEGENHGTYYSNDVVVQDNYTFQHGNKGYEAAGKWMVVRRNVRYGKPLIAYNHSWPPVAVSDDIYGLGTNVNNGRGWFNSLTGNRDAKVIDDNMSRGFDMAGWNVWTHANIYEGTGSNPGVDGEGILYQNMGAVEVFSVAETYNKGQNCFGAGGGYIHPYDVNIIGMLQGWNITQTGYGFSCKPGNEVQDYSIIGNSGTYTACNNITVRDEMKDSDCNSAAAPAAPFEVTAIFQPDRGSNLITWSDASNAAKQEVGFKIERSPVGTSTWTTICWRPRNSTGGVSGPENPYNWTYSASDRGGGAITEPLCVNQLTDLNPQAWEDFMLGNQVMYDYRVCAMGCSPTDTSGCSIITSNQSPMVRNESGSLLLYPVPALDGLNLRLENKYQGNVGLRIMSVDGKEVFRKNLSKIGDVLNDRLPSSFLKAGTYYMILEGKGFSERMTFAK